MIRPPDEQCTREEVLLGSGTSFASGGENDGPLMSDAIRWGNLLFLSGRAAVDPLTGALRAQDFDGQLQLVLDDALAVLTKAGGAARNVLRVECWLADRMYFAGWNARFASTFPPPRPARTTLITPDFPVPGMLVEIQLTAAVGA